MGRFIMSPEKFKSLEADAKHSDKIKKLTTTGDFTGVIDTHDVTIDYNYNPGTQTLNFNVGAKHSLAAKMASDNIIEQHIIQVLFNLESAPPAPSPTLGQGTSGSIAPRNTITNTPIKPTVPTPVKPNPVTQPNPVPTAADIKKEETDKGPTPDDQKRES